MQSDPTTRRRRVINETRHSTLWIVQWVLLLLAALSLQQIAVELADTMSPNNAGLRILVHIMVTVLAVLAILAIAHRRGQIPGTVHPTINGLGAMMDPSSTGDLPGLQLQSTPPTRTFFAPHRDETHSHTDNGF